MTIDRYGDVAILGSCVSRDMVQISMSAEIRRPLYVARQSILSFYRPATENKPSEPEFKHGFQLSSYRSDVNGTGLKQVILAAGELNIVLVDMVDERHGVYVSPIGEVITRSIDGMGTDLYEKLEGWRLVDFGTPEHKQDFAKQTAMMRDRLTSAGLFEKTWVILAPWATHLSTGEKTPWSMGKTAEWANSVLPDYEKVFENLGFNILRPEPETIIGDPNHQWGPAPFHYVQAFYDSIACQVRPLLQNARAKQ